MLRAIPWVLFLAAAAVCLYGILAEGLYAQQPPVWDSVGIERFLAYAAAYWIAAALILRSWPRGLPWIAGAFVLAYSAWWAGPAAPLAAVYFLASCYALGRLLGARAGERVQAVLLGAAAWMFVLWCSLHFPVNRPRVYWVAFAIPLVMLGWRRFMNPGTRPSRAAAPSGYERAALAVLLFVLLAHWLSALKPEAGTDALAVHLALPAQALRDAQWQFDFQQAAWSLMPAGADVLFTAVYLLGGEHAAHLWNAALLGLIAAMIAQAAQRWVPKPHAYLAAALFLSTPLVQLVTASLLVENTWAALILAAVLALLRYLDSAGRRDLLFTAAFCGAAMAVKYGALAFAAPILIVGAIAAARRREGRTSFAAAALALVLAAPPYAYSYARTGNPIYPFRVRASGPPSIDVDQEIAMQGYAATPVSWKTPFELTFRSRSYIEGQDGAAGFQYFLLLLPALWWARRRDQWILPVIALAGMFLVLRSTPHLRFLYPALALLSPAIAWIFARSHAARVFAAMVPLIALNLTLLPAAGWNHKDFTFYSRDEAARSLPAVRQLIGRLNREHPREPAALFSSSATAGLLGPAYVDSWHSEPYWREVRESATPEDIARVFALRGIRQVIAPASREHRVNVVRRFLETAVEPQGEPLNGFAIFRLRDAVPRLESTVVLPFGPGEYDDSDSRIQYRGSWYQDRQFAQATNGSVTYARNVGDAFHFYYLGSAVTLVFTRTSNRGIAEVWVDGKILQQVDLYAPLLGWQATYAIDGFAPGEHAVEVRVSGRKNPESADFFVDLDGIRVAR